MVGKSRLQTEVLHLYKELLNAAKGKPGFQNTIRQEFRQHVAIPRSDTFRIEFMLRRGYKKLEMIKDPHISGMGHFVDKN